MAAIFNIQFPDGTFGFGPIWAGYPTLPDVAPLAQYRLQYNGEDFIVFYTGEMTPEKEKIISDYAPVHLRTFVRPKSKD